MGSSNDTTAVLLLNMGGPDSVPAIKPFLDNLFSDPAIFPLPALLRRPLAAAISTLRSRKVSERYELIGGGSPINRITGQQADALATVLSGRGSTVFARPALRYWHPFISESANWAQEKGAARIIALSLYPQYSGVTTGTCIKEIERTFSGGGQTGEPVIIDRWPTHPLYIKALAGTINDAIEKIPSEEQDDAILVFSAHGVPLSVIKRGDPYLDEITQTVDGVVRSVGGRPHCLAFQSRLGPVKWLEPYLADTLADLAPAGAPVVIVPISFVSDNIETLYDLDIQHRQIAHELGITTYVRAEALNTRPDFIEAMADIVAAHIGG